VCAQSKEEIAMDILQIAVFVVLLVILFLSYFFFLKKAIKEFLKARRTRVVRRLTLKDALSIALFFSMVFASGMGAWWVITVGFEGLPRAILLSGGGAFVFAFAIFPFFYVCNAISRWEMKRKSKKQE
jgi:hypothetical protein